MDAESHATTEMGGTTVRRAIRQVQGSMKLILIFGWIAEANGVCQLRSRREHLVGITCAACGCPESGSPIFHVRVPRTDVDRLRAAGWSIEG